MKTATNLKDDEILDFADRVRAAVVRALGEEDGIPPSHPMAIKAKREIAKMINALTKDDHTMTSDSKGKLHLVSIYVHGQHRHAFVWFNKGDRPYVPPIMLQDVGPGTTIGVG
jgi:hypothetical protein